MKQYFKKYQKMSLLLYLSVEFNKLKWYSVLYENLKGRIISLDESVS